MKVPVPQAPEMTPTRSLWAVVIAIGIFVLTVGLMHVWPPLALIPNILLLLAAVWLIGGEMWNMRGE